MRPVAHRRQNRGQVTAAAVLVASMYMCWSRTRMFCKAYAIRAEQMEKNEWWWRQCSDMQFYEKMQEHMDICNQLKVIPQHTVKWLAARDVLSTVDFAEISAALLLAVLLGISGMLASSELGATRSERRTRPLL